MLTRIALRNILRNRRRSLITLLVISFGGIGIILFGGYKAITFRNLRESTIRSRTGHIQLYRKGYSTAESQKPLEYGIDDVVALRTLAENDPRVKTTAAQITLMGLISNGEKSETFMATAVEPSKEVQMSGQRIVAGTPLPMTDPDAVIVGRGLATAMKAKPGDYLTLMSTTSAGSLNALDVRVAGIFMSGVKEYDDRAIKMSLGAAQQLLQSTKVEKLLLFLHSTGDTETVQRDVQATAGNAGFPIESKRWIELAPFYRQVVVLYNGIFGFLGIIVFAVVIFSVANTITMSTFERTREIGTMMALGTSRSRVWSLFFIEGVLVGVIGGLAALAAGAAVAELINASKLMLPPPPGYTVGYRLQILLQPQVALTAFLISVTTATLSSIIPALRASRLSVVDALRHI